MKTVIEPYRSRLVEPIRVTTLQARERAIQAAAYNPFRLPADLVMIDLVTDSGTSALSVRQWSAMAGADESFTGSRSFARFADAARALTGHTHVIPCHQGRAGEHLLARGVVRPGDLILANTLFATTRENFERAGATCVDLPVAAADDPLSAHAFKGDIDLERLAAALVDNGENVRMVVLTVTDNSHGGAPVALATVRAAARLCRAHGVPLWLDAARIAENAALVATREDAERGRQPREVAVELLSLVDGVFMSLKKDALGNVGGLITLNDARWAEAIRAELLASEGIPTAGGLAGRDLECAAVALEEMFDPDHLAFRVATTTRLSERLAAAGVPVVRPPGVHALYIDGRRFCPHLPDQHLPAWSISVALYLHAGVRSWEVGNVTRGRRDRVTGDWSWPALDLLRLAIPRRVYSQAQLDYAVEALVELHSESASIRGHRLLEPVPSLPQFVASFEPA